MGVSFCRLVREGVGEVFAGGEETCKVSEPMLAASLMALEAGNSSGE